MRNRGKRTLRQGPSDWSRRRVEADLSLRDLAELTGINAGLLSMLEQGRWIPDPDQSAKLLDAFVAGKGRLQ